MKPTFETHVIAVGELFAGDNSFRLPLFQRAYSWGEEQAAQLVDDLMTGYERIREKRVVSGPGGYLFLGPIILARAGLSGPQDVVDGQQRLITLSAILAIIRDLLPPGNFQSDLQKRLARPQDAVNRMLEGPRIQVQDINRNAYAQWICRPNGTHSISRDPPEHDVNLRVALARIRSDIGNPSSDYLQGLARYILEHTFVIRVQAQSLDDAFLLFRSVNTPGEPLSGLDLAKGELLGREGAGSRDAIRLADAWDHLERGLRREQLETYISTVLAVSSPDYDGTDLKAGLRSILADTQRITEFRHNLGSFVRSYANLEIATLDFGQDSNVIIHVAACFRGLPFDDWRPSALLWLTRQRSSRSTLTFLRALNGLCLAFVILGVASGKRKRRFSKINGRVSDGSVLTAATSELYLTPQERADIRARLGAPIPHNSKFIKALLLRINAEIQHKVIPPYFPKDITIEHVLPRTTAPRSRWNRDFPARRKDLCLSLGNLTILTQDANSTIRNIDFDAKKSEIFGANGNQAFALNQQIACAPRWDEETITRRRDELIAITDRLLMP